MIKPALPNKRGIEQERRRLTSDRQDFDRSEPKFSFSIGAGAQKVDDDDNSEENRDEDSRADSLQTGSITLRQSFEADYLPGSSNQQVPQLQTAVSPCQYKNRTMEKLAHLGRKDDDPIVPVLGISARPRTEQVGTSNLRSSPSTRISSENDGLGDT